MDVSPEANDVKPPGHNDPRSDRIPIRQAHRQKGFFRGAKEPAPYDDHEMKRRFLDADSGSRLWSEMNRQDWQSAEAEKKCVYCGTAQDLRPERIISESIRIKPACKACSRMRAANNHVWSCGLCHAKRGDRGVYEFYRALHPEKIKFYDGIPTVLERKYLKTVYHCHQCAGTLNSGDIDGDGELTVLDIDFVLHR